MGQVFRAVTRVEAKRRSKENWKKQPKNDGMMGIFHFHQEDAGIWWTALFSGRAQRVRETEVGMMV